MCFHPRRRRGESIRTHPHRPPPLQLQLPVQQPLPALPQSLLSMSIRLVPTALLLWQVGLQTALPGSAPPMELLWQALGVVMQQQPAGRIMQIKLPPMAPLNSRLLQLLRMVLLILGKVPNTYPHCACLAEHTPTAAKHHWYCKVPAIMQQACPGLCKHQWRCVPNWCDRAIL